MSRSTLQKRTTKETDITLKLELDGIGKSNVETGIGFFNHMLEGFAKHGFFDLEIQIRGDLKVDDIIPSRTPELYLELLSRKR